MNSGDLEFVRMSASATSPSCTSRRYSRGRVMPNSSAASRLVAAGLGQRANDGLLFDRRQQLVEHDALGLPWRTCDAACARVMDDGGKIGGRNLVRAAGAVGGGDRLPAAHPVRPASGRAQAGRAHRAAASRLAYRCRGCTTSRKHWARHGQIFQSLDERRNSNGDRRNRIHKRRIQRSRHTPCAAAGILVAVDFIVRGRNCCFAAQLRHAERACYVVAMIALGTHFAESPTAIERLMRRGQAFEVFQQQRRPVASVAGWAAAAVECPPQQLLSQQCRNRTE